MVCWTWGYPWSWKMILWWCLLDCVEYVQKGYLTNCNGPCCLFCNGLFLWVLICFNHGAWWHCGPNLIAQSNQFNQGSHDSMNLRSSPWLDQHWYDWISTSLISLSWIYGYYWYHQYHWYHYDIVNSSELYNDWIFYDNSVFHMTITLRLVESPRIAAAIWAISPFVGCEKRSSVIESDFLYFSTEIFL